MKSNILIAKNVKIAVEAIVARLESKNFEVIATTPDAQEAIAQIRTLMPDVALIGCELDNGTNLEVITALNDLRGQTKFVLYTIGGQAFEILDAFKNGVDGYLHTTTELDELVECLYEVMDDRKYLCKTLQKNFIESDNQQWSSFQNLSQRERQILWLVANGKSNKEIADDLFLSADTINNHRRNIRQKLNLEGGKLSMIQSASELEAMFELQELKESLGF